MGEQTLVRELEAGSIKVLSKLSTEMEHPKFAPIERLTTDRNTYY